MSVVKFRLIEKTSNRPIPFVWIYLQSEAQPYQETTDANGWARFPNLPDGDYIVKVRSPDHRPYTKKSFISRNSIIEIPLERAYI